MIRLLLWIGFIRRYKHGPQKGHIRWPFSFSPWWLWKVHFFHGPRFGLFQNRPGVVKWIPGRLLPRRWGFFILGFEFGDRG